MYTTLTDNNQADTVLELFIKGVQEFGLPSRVRSDHGLENVGVAQYMLENRGLNRGSIITGSFVHNCRIERAYNEMFTLVSFVTLPISWVEWKTWVSLTHESMRHFWLFSNPVSLGQKYILEPIPLPRSSLARYQRGAVGFFPSSRNKLSGEVESTFFGVYF